MGQSAFFCEYCNRAIALDTDIRGYRVRGHDFCSAACAIKWREAQPTHQEELFED